MRATQFARSLAFALARAAAPKHGDLRHARAARFARACAAKSERRGQGRGSWDQAIALLDHAAGRA